MEHFENMEKVSSSMSLFFHVAFSHVSDDTLGNEYHLYMVHAMQKANE